MADDELEQIKKLREAKRQRLRIVEQQIAQFGEKWAPAHLLADRAELRESITKYETVLGSSTPTEVGDDLGAGGRFVLTLEEFKTVKDGLALLGYQVGGFIDEMRDFVTDTKTYRAAHTTEHLHYRRWIVGGAIALGIIAAFVLGRLI